MKRKIIRIDEDLCNGCGACITGCAEGALALVDGKAKLVKEQYCDGFGDCIGTCPTGALTIEERESEAYDEVATGQHVAMTRGDEGLQEFQQAAARHDHPAPPAFSGCPGMRQRSLDRPASVAADPASGGQVIPSELSQWPIMLHLVQPRAPFFDGRELAVLSTCSPVASPDVNGRFVRGRSVVVACPKLDRTDGYVEKLTEIFRNPSIPRVLVVRMEVPCCGGLTAMVRQAAAACGRDDLRVEEATLSLEGKLLKTETL